MKRTKFSKLVSVVMVACMMMLSVVSAGAAASVTGKQDITTTKITVEGITEDINMAGVALVLLSPDVTDEAVAEMIENGVWDEEVVASVGQTFADAEGNYTYEFTLASDAAYGEYRIVATSNDVAETTVYFASPATRKSALEKILKATDDATVIKVIDDEGVNLGVDTEFWASLDDEAKKDAADAIRTNDVLGDMNADALTEADIATAAAEIDAESLTAALNAGMIDDLSDYADKISNEEAMEIYEGLSDTAKAYAVDLVSNKNYKQAADMEEALGVMVKIAFIVNDGTTNIETVKDYASDLSLDKATAFANLTAKQQREVLSAVKSAKPTTVSALNTAFKTAVASYESQGGGNGGNGGSGSSSIITSGGSKEETDNNTTDSLGSDTEIVYIDLGGYDWAEDAIYALSKKGILAGYGDGIFGPSNQIKREEFAKIIVAALYGQEAIDADKVPSFADAQNGWYSPFVGYAEGTGIVKGISAEEFGVGRNIKRQDIMTILYRVMVAYGIDVNTTAIAYGDAADIDDYAKDAVYALANAGVVGGYEDGSMRPQGEATRAEVAVMIYKFLNIIGK